MGAGKWEMVRLGDVCAVVSGTTPKSNVAEYWNGEHNWVTPAELTNDTIFVTETERKITTKAIKESSLKPFPAGTVLLSSRAPIGKVAIAGTEMYCNQGFKNLVCSLRVHNIYLYWYLKNNTDYLNSLGRGATFKEISKQIVEDIVIPVPPIPTQQKIATTLDTVADILRLRKAQLEQLDLLVKARFVEMFGDPVENPKGWEVATLRAVANRISDGPFGSNLKSEHYSEQGVRVIRLQNIGSSEFIDIDKVFIPNDHYGKLKKYTCLPGDIVIGTLGDPNLRACIIPAHINSQS